MKKRCEPYQGECIFFFFNRQWFFTFLIVFVKNLAISTFSPVSSPSSNGMRMCVRVCVHAGRHACMHVCMCTGLVRNELTCQCSAHFKIIPYTHTHMRTHYTHTPHTHMHTTSHTYMHTHTHMHMHTHTHTFSHHLSMAD